MQSPTKRGSGPQAGGPLGVRNAARREFEKHHSQLNLFGVGVDSPKRVGLRRQMSRVNKYVVVVWVGTPLSFCAPWRSFSTQYCIPKKRTGRVRSQSPVLHVPWCSQSGSVALAHVRHGVLTMTKRSSLSCPTASFTLPGMSLPCYTPLSRLPLVLLYVFIIRASPVFHHYTDARMCAGWQVKKSNCRDFVLYELPGMHSGCPVYVPSSHTYLFLLPDCCSCCL